MDLNYCLLPRRTYSTGRRFHCLWLAARSLGKDLIKAKVNILTRGRLDPIQQHSKGSIMKIYSPCSLNNKKYSTYHDRELQLTWCSGFWPIKPSWMPPTSPKLHFSLSTNGHRHHCNSNASILIKLITTDSLWSWGKGKGNGEVKHQQVCSLSVDRESPLLDAMELL